MKKNLFKRGMAGLLSLVMCLTALVGIGTTTAYAAGERAEVYLVSFPRSGDANIDYSGTWGHPNLRYMNGWHSGESKYTTIRAMHSYDGNICYCIEPGVQQDTGDTYTSKDETFWDNLPSDINSTISPYDMKLFIGRIMQYGYTGPISTSWRSQNPADAATLAEAMVLVTPFLVRKNSNAAVFGFALYSVSATYFFIEFVVGLIFVFVKSESYKASLVVQIIIAGVYAIMLIANMIANENTADSTERHEDEVAYIKRVSSRVKMLVGKSTDRNANKEMERVYDLLHSSPSKSSMTVKNEEAEIVDKIANLEGAVASNSASDIIAISNEIISLVEERNRKLRI